MYLVDTVFDSWKGVAQNGRYLNVTLGMKLGKYPEGSSFAAGDYDDERGLVTLFNGNNEVVAKYQLCLEFYSVIEQYP